MMKSFLRTALQSALANSLTVSAKSRKAGSGSVNDHRASRRKGLRSRGIVASSFHFD